MFLMHVNIVVLYVSKCFLILQDIVSLNWMLLVFWKFSSLFAWRTVGRTAEYIPGSRKSSDIVCCCANCNVDIYTKIDTQLYYLYVMNFLKKPSVDFFCCIPQYCPTSFKSTSVDVMWKIKIPVWDNSDHWCPLQKQKPQQNQKPTKTKINRTPKTQLVISFLDYFSGFVFESKAVF